MAWTRHGHQIPNTPVNPGPKPAVRGCRGIGVCYKCSLDSARSQPDPGENIMSALQNKTEIKPLSPFELKDRFGFHTPNEENAKKHADARVMFEMLAAKLNVLLPAGRAKNVAMTELETAAMWAQKAIAQLSPVDLSDE